MVVKSFPAGFLRLHKMRFEPCFSVWSQQTDPNGSSNQILKLKWVDPINNPALMVPHRFSNCCGARQTSGWFFNFPDRHPTFNIERIKQDFVYHMLQYLNSGTLTMYTIVTDRQVRDYKNGPLALMLELGAKIADSHRNYNHAGNEIQMLIWNKHEHCNDEVLTKYVTYNAGQYYYEPKWWADKSDAEQRAYVGTAEYKELAVLTKAVQNREQIIANNKQKSQARGAFYYLSLMNQEDRNKILAFVHENYHQRYREISLQELDILEQCKGGDKVIITQRTLTNYGIEIERREKEIADLRTKVATLEQAAKKPVRARAKKIAPTVVPQFEG